jgi:quinohemoprotein ethanol dehydrogenase
VVQIAEPPPRVDDADAIARGKQLYALRCIMCHGDGVVGGGVVPDLRYLSAERHQAWQGIVLGGLHKDKGMASFAGLLTPEESTAIQAYVIERAHQTIEAEQSP